ncbi:adult cuticle protein 1-like [Sabethes cyaneus]|uniref:adult cuticle protein 1-like n=1 Tax=Sabethes cyaneus TaxID=53552 RepID=UPI00237E3B17|nr:adult cuticle protein 1-like [Sabethes cyaneus]
MKCIAAVVMMALAVVASGNVLTYSAPWAYSSTVVQQNVVPRWAAPIPVSYAATNVVSPVAYAAPAPVAVAYNNVVPAVAPVAVVAPAEARYLAANRGAVHDAPLPGHTVSQQSLNLEPAVGTL